MINELWIAYLFQTISSYTFLFIQNKNKIFAFSYIYLLIFGIIIDVCVFFYLILKSKFDNDIFVRLSKPFKYNKIDNNDEWNDEENNVSNTFDIKDSLSNSYSNILQFNNNNLSSEQHKLIPKLINQQESLQKPKYQQESLQKPKHEIKESYKFNNNNIFIKSLNNEHENKFINKELEMERLYHKYYDNKDNSSLDLNIKLDLKNNDLNDLIYKSTRMKKNYNAIYNNDIIIDDNNLIDSKIDINTLINDNIIK